MKKCPNCQRTFDDSLRFCQSDGTPLVDDAPVDPYKTMVASSDEIAAAMGSPSDKEGAAKVDDELLQLPQDDPKKTMYTSEEEIRKEMQARDEPVIDLPPLASEPPRPAEPRYDPPSFEGSTPPAPPPSPFSPGANEPIANPMGDSPFSRTTPPIPSPFDNPKPSTYDAPTEYKPAPEPEQFRPADPVSFEPMGGPIEPIRPSAAPSWQASEPMQNSPMSPAAVGQNKTLAIVSLVLGILSIPCCGVVTGIPAVIVGFIAKSKINSNPAEYGGAGLALGGIITGVLGTIIGIILLVIQLFLGGLNALLNLPS